MDRAIPDAIAQPADAADVGPGAIAAARGSAAVMMTDAVGDSDRIAAIDVARGVAILGIFFVNIAFFSQPLGRVIGETVPPAGSHALDQIAFYFMAVFCEGKFYPLFSALFGIGFVIQLDRARLAGRPFAAAYLRRLGVLCVLGLIHGLLLWYGDILFVYSFAGLILFGTLMIFRDVRARTLLIVGAALVAFGAAAPTAMTAFGEATADTRAQPAATPVEGIDGIGAEPPLSTVAPTDGSDAASPVSRLFDGSRTGTIQEGPADADWQALETQAFRDGPFFQAFVFRAFLFLGMIVFAIMGFGWHVLGMFFIGAGLMRSGTFAREKLGLHRRFVLVGLLVGLPLVALSAFWPTIAGLPSGDALPMLLLMVGGPLVSLAYLGGATLLVASGRATAVTGTIARVGRMALSNYLLTTVIATFLMYHWGLRMFNTVSPAEQAGIVLAVYAGLVLFSNVWLRLFLFGPMEWLWRTLTYLRVQPLIRRRATAMSKIG